jgi:hypothetical protein
MNPFTVGGPKTETGNPALGPDEEVGPLVIVGHGDESSFGVLVAEIQRATNVLAVDHNLAQHCDHWSRRVVRCGGPGAKALNELI